jgi:hypothetical protein
MSLSSNRMLNNSVTDGMRQPMKCVNKECTVIENMTSSVYVLERSTYILKPFNGGGNERIIKTFSHFFYYNTQRIVYLSMKGGVLMSSQ